MALFGGMEPRHRLDILLRLLLKEASQHTTSTRVKLHRRSQARNAVPILGHDIRQYCVFPWRDLLR